MGALGHEVGGHTQAPPIPSCGLSVPTVVRKSAVIARIFGGPDVNVTLLAECPANSFLYSLAHLALKSGDSCCY